MSKKYYPLENKQNIPPSAEFGAIRKHDIHTGIDLHSPEGSKVFSIEDGEVLKIDCFTGTKAGSPWWEETDYIGVGGNSGYILYGEVSSFVQVGQKVKAGDLIGTVKRVLKKDKGLPVSMLHLEHYAEFVENPFSWEINERQPSKLLNPLGLIKDLRFNHDCCSFDEASKYLKNRAKQLLSDNVSLTRITSHQFGAIAYWEKDKKPYVSFFIYPQYRGKGLYKKITQEINFPVLTVQDCQIANFLKENQIPHLVCGDFLDTAEYKEISLFYSNQKATRSNIFLMNHIDEGLFVLKNLSASETAMKAFCLHPIIQSDDALKNNLPLLLNKNIDQKAIVCAMEYRSVANEYLSTRTLESIDHIRLSPLKDVNDMLIADKVQNYKDFILYHKDSHPRRSELDQYFKNWFKKLHISQNLLNNLIDLERNYELI